MEDTKNILSNLGFEKIVDCNQEILNYTLSRGIKEPSIYSFKDNKKIFIVLDWKSDIYYIDFSFKDGPFQFIKQTFFSTKVFNPKILETFIKQDLKRQTIINDLKSKYNLEEMTSADLQLNDLDQIKAKHKESFQCFKIQEFNSAQLYLLITQDYTVCTFSKIQDRNLNFDCFKDISEIEDIISKHYLVKLKRIYDKIYCNQLSILNGDYFNFKDLLAFTDPKYNQIPNSMILRLTSKEINKKNFFNLYAEYFLAIQDSKHSIHVLFLSSFPNHTTNIESKIIATINQNDYKFDSNNCNSSENLKEFMQVDEIVSLVNEKIKMEKLKIEALDEKEIHSLIRKNESIEDSWTILSFKININNMLLYFFLQSKISRFFTMFQSRTFREVHCGKYIFKSDSEFFTSTPILVLDFNNIRSTLNHGLNSSLLDIKSEQNMEGNLKLLEQLDNTECYDSLLKNCLKKFLTQLKILHIAHDPSILLSNPQLSQLFKKDNYNAICKLGDNKYVYRLIRINMRNRLEEYQIVLKSYPKNSFVLKSSVYYESGYCESILYKSKVPNFLEFIPGSKEIFDRIDVLFGHLKCDNIPEDNNLKKLEWLLKTQIFDAKILDAKTVEINPENQYKQYLLACFSKDSIIEIMQCLVDPNNNIIKNIKISASLIDDSIYNLINNNMEILSKEIENIRKQEKKKEKSVEAMNNDKKNAEESKESPKLLFTLKKSLHKLFIKK